MCLSLTTTSAAPLPRPLSLFKAPYDAPVTMTAKTIDCSVIKTLSQLASVSPVSHRGRLDGTSQKINCVKMKMQSE